jgi:hypothetical protein
MRAKIPEFTRALPERVYRKSVQETAKNTEDAEEKTGQISVSSVAVASEWIMQSGALSLVVAQEWDVLDRWEISLAG